MNESPAAGTTGFDPRDSAGGSASAQQPAGRRRSATELMSQISHEIRTPLNGVIGMLELLRGTELSHQQRRFLRVASASADTLLSLISDLLDYSEIEAGQIRIEHDTFDLQELLEDVVESFLPRVEAKGIELALHVQGEIPKRLSGDRERVRQILVNLVSNAVKFTDRGTVIVSVESSRCTAHDLDVVLSVSDSGPGIPPDRLAGLYQPFSRAGAQARRQYGGLGLGLAVCKRLTQLLGGTIETHARPEGGTIFAVTLPLTLTAGEPPRSATALPDLRILAVDDNAANLSVLEAHLSNWKVDFALADSGFRALELLQQAADCGRPFDLALLDMEMPNMDGLELARQIKLRPELQETQLIMITSTGDSLSRERMIACGLSAYLCKPVRQARLRAAIAEAAASRSACGIAPAARAGVPLNAQADRPTHVRILLAEDNEINQLVATEILIRAGYRCDVVASGRAAFESMLDGEYDLILMDCQMPDMDGLEATRAIRQHERNVDPDGRAERISIVALTANATKIDRQRCLAAGMDAYVTKPIDPGQLIGTIDALLAQRKRDSRCSTNRLMGEPSLPPPFDLESFLHRCLGDTEFSSLLLQKFAARAMDHRNNLQRAGDNGNLADLAREAHTLKGVAANLSANELQARCARLEQAARTGSVDPTARLLNEVLEELSRCQQSVPNLLAELTCNA